MIRRALFKVGLTAIVILLASCSMQESRTAEEWFNFTWSGLAGIDSLTFQGQAAVARGELQKLDEQVGFVGELKEHRKLRIQSTLPAEKQAEQGKEQYTAAADGLQSSNEVTLDWNGESWNVAENHSSGLASGLARYNPLSQIESIRRTGKKVTAEHAAARGTQVLRIQLEPEAAKRMLSGQLTKEMDEIRNGWQKRLKELPETQRSKVQQALEREWSTDSANLQKLLNTCNAEAVYYLTINRNTGLPTRLTSETRLVYTTNRGVQEHEVLLTDSKFEYSR